MSLLRFLGLDASDRRHENEPASLVEIAAQLESLPPAEARFVAAYSYLLARIAGADLSTDTVERDVMARRLEEFAQIDADRAALLTEAAVRASETYSPSDDHLVARAYAEMSGEEERIRLLRCLYAVAAADETITTVEDNEIFDVAAAIGIRRADVIAVRSEFKQWLAALRALPNEH